MTRKLAALCLIITLVTIAFAQGDSTLMRALVEELRGIRHALNGLVAAEAIKPIDNDVTFGETAFANGDATPSVVNQTSFRTANSTATTITGFDGGQLGQVINLRCADGTNSTTTIDGGLTATGMTIPLIVGDTLQWMWDGSAWKQVGGSVGMGRYVPVEPVDVVGDWIALSTTSATDVEVSDDGVPKGAVAVLLLVHFFNTDTNYIYLVARKNGSGATASRLQMGPGGSVAHSEIAVALDGDAVLEAYWSVDWSGASNATSSATVVGYWI